MTTIRTPENAERVKDMLDHGMSLRKIAPELGCSEMALRKWVRDDEEFGSHYKRSRDMLLDSMADEIVELSDEAKSFEQVAIARLRVDTRKWYLCKLAPKRYGDKLDLNHGGQGTDGKPVEVVHRVIVDLGD